MEDETAAVKKDMLIIQEAKNGFLVIGRDNKVNIANTIDEAFDIVRAEFEK